jgi:hypothetical protein
MDTKAIDAEIDRMLSVEAPLPLPMTTRQRTVKLSSKPRTAWRYVAYGAFVVILVACSRIDGWWHESRAPLAENNTGLVPLASISRVASVPAPIAAAVTQDEAAAPGASGVELALTATEETWLSVSSDGAPVFSGLLEANQTKKIEGKEFARVRVGNAAGLEVRLNGKPLGPLGAHGQVRDLDFTSGKAQPGSLPNDSE